MTEPVSLAQAKAQCRIVDDTSEDALISSYIKAAREYVEEQTGHILVQREFVEQRDRFTAYLEITRRPIVGASVVVSYTDTSGDTQTYAEPLVSAVRYPARIYPALNGWWPSLGRNGDVTITYTAGYADGEAPQRAIQAILLLIGHWWSKREAVEISTAQPADVPYAVTALLDQLRGSIL